MRAELKARDHSLDCQPDQRASVVVELIADVRQRHSLADLAAHLNLSPSRLEHVFKAQTGVSIRSFSINFRLHRAAAMLTSTDAAVKTILYETGFNHPANFSHLFRRHFGVSARDFRRQHLSQQERPIDCACAPNALCLVQAALRLS